MNRSQSRRSLLKRIALLSWIPILIAGVVSFLPVLYASAGLILWVVGVSLQLFIGLTFFLQAIRSRSARGI